MPYKVIYFDEALHDVSEAKKWYRKQQEGLQKKFSSSIKKTIARLQNHPTAFAIRYKNVRIANSDTFPYGVHFYFDSGKQERGIIGVIHNRRGQTAEGRIQPD